ncbi:lamin tail domain-containing protein [archaeon]|nr:lamin tail domain-containing protein [archaeon]PJC45631.1 MAG: hypothetical protein CO037_00480 [Candidatus Pacearchaeota archaeon CG_4_9_14_0_2_um_filter_30_8]
MKKLVLVFLLILFLVNFVSAVRINEIMYKPDFSQSYNEWIELYNDESEEINLSEFSLCEKNLVAGYVNRQGEIQNDGGLILGAGGFALITDGGSSGTEVYENFDVGLETLAIHVESATLCGGLTDAGKILTLEKGDETYEELAYSDDVEKGYSLEFKEGKFLKSQNIHGTPGEENSDSNLPETNESTSDPKENSSNEPEEEVISKETSDEVENSNKNQKIIVPSIKETKEEENLSLPIRLNPKDIKTQNSLQNEEKKDYSKYLFFIFCLVLLLLYIIKFRKRKNEWKT